jgi:hypothetical protein
VDGGIFEQFPADGQELQEPLHDSLILIVPPPKEWLYCTPFSHFCTLFNKTPIK